MEISDFLCDFCRRGWDGTFPLVEGHQGSLICGGCLTLAYTEVVLMGRGVSVAGDGTCTLCLEHREDPHWVSPAFDEAWVCLRCIKQSAGRLHKDEDWSWERPGA